MEVSPWASQRVPRPSSCLEILFHGLPPNRISIMTTERGERDGGRAGFDLEAGEGCGSPWGERSDPFKVLVASGEAPCMSTSLPPTNPCNSRSIMIDKRLG